MAHQHPFPWKAAAPSLALSAVLLAVTVCANSMLLVSNQASNAAIIRSMEAYDAAVELELSVREMRRLFKEFLDYGDRRTLDEVDQLRNVAEWQLSVVEDFLIGEDGASDSGIMGAFEEILQRLQAAALANNHAEASLIVEEVLNEDLLATVSAIRELTKAALDSARNDSLYMTTAVSWLLLGLGLSGTAAGVYAGFSRARALQQQMVELTVSVNSAAGSLDDVCEQLDPVAIKPSGDLSHVQSMVDLLVERVSGVVRRLQEAERESIRRDQLASLGQLAAGLAHELRNPLTAIKTLVEAARGSRPGGTLDDRDLQVMEEELSRLDSTLQSFLDYARPPKSTRREIDVRQLIQNTLHLLSSQLERLSIHVDSILPADSVRMTADPEQLKQVLLNVFLNAVDAMGDGGTLTVSLHELRKDNRVEIAVDDTGPGISDGIRDRLFEPFASSKPSGTGLGLTISRRIVESHGGTIVAENRAAGGARFRITLPIDATGTNEVALTAEQSSATSRAPAAVEAASHSLKMSQT